MEADIPKSYLAINGQTIFSITLRQLLACDRIDHICVAVSKDDTHIKRESVTDSARVSLVQGGSERQASVLNGLLHLKQWAEASDWVLVHDVARPLISLADLSRLMDELDHDPVGGILATPVKDTLKSVGPNNIIQKTVPRTNLWAALTPQMFRYGVLLKALETAVRDNVQVTDEAAAVEYIGEQARIVPGDATNIKLTYPADLRIVEALLNQ